MYSFVDTEKLLDHLQTLGIKVKSVERYDGASGTMLDVTLESGRVATYENSRHGWRLLARRDTPIAPKVPLAPLAAEEYIEAAESTGGFFMFGDAFEVSA